MKTKKQYAGKGVYFPRLRSNGYILHSDWSWPPRGYNGAFVAGVRIA